MSRGHRISLIDNVSTSMRENYNQHGVSEFYRKVGSTYRNPHFPGIRDCLFLWLNRWWEMERANNVNENDRTIIFDMACDSGEVTLAVLDWWKIGNKLFADMSEGKIVQSRRRASIVPPLLDPKIQPTILAADPYTAKAYIDRTSLPCAPLAFKDISEGGLPPFPEPSVLQTSHPSVDSPVTLEMVVCSFALHLVEDSSQLFAVLWELSLKSRWLVVLAPHKKPQIKEGWGWTKWNVNVWQACQMTHDDGEYLSNRVHCRVYRSLNHH